MGLFDKQNEERRQAREAKQEQRAKLLELRQEIIKLREEQRAALSDMRAEHSRLVAEQRIAMSELKTLHARQRLEMREKERQAEDELKSLGTELASCHTALSEYK